MSIIKAVRLGLARGFGSWGLVLGLWLLGVAVALPMTLVVVEVLHGSLGQGLAHDELREGFDMGWYGEFKADASGAASTFGPDLLGGGAFFRNIESWLTGGLFDASYGLLGMGALYGLLWALVWGGVISRFASPDEGSGPGRLLTRGAEFFFRFVRLALLSAPLYYLIYKLYGWLDDRLGQWTRDITSEFTMLAITLLLVGAIGFLLSLVHVCFAYAKIATVLEDRRSMLFAALRGIGFVLSHPGRALGVYYVMALVGVILLAIYSLIAPGPHQASALGVLFAFGVGQLFLMGRLAVRLSLYAGLVSLYKSLTGG